MTMKPQNDALTSGYYFWLCDLIGVNQVQQNYYLLVKDLYARSFEWTVPNDDNRAYEGIALREQYCDEHSNLCKYEGFLTNEPCSMLELLIALAYRCEKIMIDQGAGMKMYHWFWKMLSNVELSKFTDEAYYDLVGPIVIDQILDKIIKRTYHRNGEGGLFPLKHQSKDQRKIELWYQMSEYLVENYYQKERVL